MRKALLILILIAKLVLIIAGIIAVVAAALILYETYTTKRIKNKLVPTEVRKVRYSEDGTHIFYSAYAESNDSRTEALFYATPDLKTNKKLYEFSEPGREILAISPTRKYVAFMTDKTNRSIFACMPGCSKFERKIIILDIKSSKVVGQIVSRTASLSGIVWHPSRTKFCYAGEEGIYLFDLNTLKSKKIIDGGGYLLHALTWSSDGKYIVYTSYNGADEVFENPDFTNSLYLYDYEKKKSRTLYTKYSSLFPSALIDSKNAKVYFSVNADSFHTSKIYSVDPTKLRQTELWSRKRTRAGVSISTPRLLFADSEKRLVFDTYDDTYDIYLLNLSEKQVKKIKQGRDIDWDFIWDYSPKTNKIISQTGSIAFDEKEVKF